MTGKIHNSIFILILAALLTACQSPEMPQQVAAKFWQAVIDDEVDRVVDYSTLADAGGYDRFSMDWQGFKPVWGKTIIENNNASVEATFDASSGDQSEQRKLTTYLVLQSKLWKVDYHKTREGLKPKKSEGLLGKLNELGRELSERLGDSTDELNTELDKLGDKLQELSDQVGKDAEAGIEKFADDLTESLRELEESIDRALKEDREKEPEQSEGQLQEI